jgi:hypothetical protein
MRRFWSDMNPTVRGFLIIGLIALAVVVLQLWQTLAALGIILRIAFFLAIAFVLYMLWRDRVRGDAETWSRRAQLVFYGAAGLILADLAVFFWPGRGPIRGLDAISFVLVLVICGFAMWRVWKDEHSYGY